jgi:sulfopropanediol 3-dehydrogenase
LRQIPQVARAAGGFSGHGEQANIRFRSYGGRNLPYSGVIE